MKEVNGQTALLMAAWGGHVEIVRALLAAGAEVDRGKDGHPRPLYKAAYGGHTACVELLLAAGADKEYKTMLGETALDAATKKEHTDVVGLLS